MRINFVYWLHDETCTNPKVSGYVGVTADLPKRISSHRKKRSQRFGIFQYVILFEGTRDECFAVEARLRPHSNIGWNICQGGKDGYRKEYKRPDLSEYNTKHKKGKPSGRKGKPNPLKGIPNLKARGRKGYIRSEEVRSKLRACFVGKSQPKIPCEFCGKLSSVANLGKWHGIYCLKNPNGRPRPPSPQKGKSNPKVAAARMGTRIVVDEQGKRRFVKTIGDVYTIEPNPRLPVP